MQRPITIAITVAITGLFALLLWRTGLVATEKDAAVASARAKAEYAIPLGSFLPVLQPSW
jgi:hypothetical protein